MPPKMESTVASTINWDRMVFGVAPRAFLIPISLVLSTTVTSMMFMIPIPPTRREMAAMAARKVVRYPVTDSVISTSSWAEET